MSELDKALKNFWYDQGFDKMVSHWEANTELNVFAKGWRAALEWVSCQCPINEKASFANQGQGMDGYTELANYKAMYKKLKEELDAKT